MRQITPSEALSTRIRFRLKTLKFFFLFLPPVHTYPMKTRTTVTENENFWKRFPKWKLFIRKHRFRVLVCTPENGTFRKGWRREVEFSALRMRLLQYSTWRSISPISCPESTVSSVMISGSRRPGRLPKAWLRIRENDVRCSKILHGLKL